MATHDPRPALPGQDGIAGLTARVAQDLAYLDFPRDREWTLPHWADGKKVLDVLIVGGGQCGLSTAFALRRERVGNVLVIDRNPQGLEGPWSTYARMHELRTPKVVTGPDLGIASLTPRAWFEARYGAPAWEEIASLPRTDWADYLAWFRETTGIKVENRTELQAIESHGQYLKATIKGPTGERIEYARKIVLATGFQGSGAVTIPGLIQQKLQPRSYAHSSEIIDFEALRGRRVAVIGAGASAFENAATALEHGAAQVDILVRRAQVPSVNAFHWGDFSGVMRHFGELSDQHRWRFSRRLLEAGHPPPIGTLKRCEPYENFRVRTGESWSDIVDHGDHFDARTQAGWSSYEFVICGTGNTPDARLFPPLASFADQIATWADRYTPQAGDENPALGNYPYLGPDFQLTEKTPGSAPLLRHIHTPNYCAQVSMGNSAGAFALRFSIPRLVTGLIRELFVSDADDFYTQFIEFKAPEPADLNTLNA